jgi:hypothetical protein
MKMSGMTDGRKALKEEALAQHRLRREFDLERLRAPIRRELRVHGGQRRVAAEMRIPRGSLRKFLSMQSVPTGRNFDSLESWVADRPEAVVTGGMVSLAVLAGELPAEIRLRTRRHLARELAKLYRGAGALLPGWLHDEVSEPQGDDF